MDPRKGKRYKFDRTQRNGDKSLMDLFEVFYNAKVAEGRADRTLETYIENTRYFVEYLQSVNLQPTMPCITIQTIRDYSSWMLHGKRKWDGHLHKSEKDRTIGLSPVTVNTRLKPLKAMFKFLHAEGLIETNPTARMGKIAEPVKDIKIMSIEEMRKLLAVPNRRSYAGFRDYVLMHVLIDSFGRIGEILSLKKSDIDFKRGFISFTETVVKTRRGRHVPLSKRTMRLLKELVTDSADFDSEFVFLTNYGENISDDRIRDRLKEHAEKAGISIRIYPHLFRHTAATMFLEDGGDLRHLASILGHSDMRMVLRYTHLSDASLKSQHERFAPLNKVITPQQQKRKIKREPRKNKDD